MLDDREQIGLAEIRQYLLGEKLCQYIAVLPVTLAIQRETGGNLAETLANLAGVLRMRAQMKLKIKALSSEAKASAWIVGSLPFFVTVMISWVDAPYLAGFMKDDRLIACGIGGAVWMGIGVFIMAKMCNFEF